MLFRWANSHCGEWDPAAWATTGIPNLCPGSVLGEVTPASHVFHEDTTRKTTVTGSKSNLVWRKDRHQGFVFNYEGYLHFIEPPPVLSWVVLSKLDVLPPHFTVLYGCIVLAVLAKSKLKKESPNNTKTINYTHS